MRHEEATIKQFTDLNAWKHAHELVVRLYKITRSFPKEEQFGLTSQMRRAAVSVTSNVAEGFSRVSSANRSHFYSMAHASLTELQSQLMVARDVGYMSESNFKDLYDPSVVTHKLLTGLIKATKERAK